MILSFSRPWSTLHEIGRMLARPSPLHIWKQYVFEALRRDSENVKVITLSITHPKRRVRGVLCDGLVDCSTKSDEALFVGHDEGLIMPVILSVDLHDAGLHLRETFLSGHAGLGRAE